MSIFRKPFGKTTLLAEDQKPVQPGQPGRSEPGETIQVWDQFGRLMQMPKDTWRTQVLLPNLAQNPTIRRRCRRSSRLPWEMAMQPTWSAR